MAYPYCCDACLVGCHGDCEASRGSAGETSEFVCGGGFCVCAVAAHHPEGNTFAESVIQKAREKEAMASGN